MDEISVQEFPDIRSLLKRLEIRLEKGKSQHYLKHQEICAQIAEEALLTKDHTVIEIGSGLGNLTVELSARCKHVYAVELDRAFEEWHEYVASSYPSIEFVYEDFLKIDLKELLKDELETKSPLCAIGNLPYQITSPILFEFVDSTIHFDQLVFMIQKEVADRIASDPGQRSTGALSYKIALGYRTEVLFDVLPEAFLPPPKVVSSVIRLTPLEKPVYKDLEHRNRLYKLLDGIFRYRRKTICNCISMASLGLSKDEATVVVEKAGIDQKARPENLLMDEVLALEANVHELREDRKS